MEWQLAQADERLAADIRWHDTGLVFTTSTGTSLAAGHVRRMFKNVCKAAGIGESWTPRELRHSFVSLMSDRGMATEEIARLVGHRSTRTTETVYRHELRPVIRSGAAIMNKIFSESEPDKSTGT
jgi:integrase